MISVIIPAYNAGQCICRAINSVLAQTFDDYEIIVVDDGSTDNTAELVKQYGSKVNCIYQDNAGVSVARNTGIAAAKGDWIAFLDADDEWLPDKLKIQAELLARNPELRWCATNFTQTTGLRSAQRISVTAIKAAMADRDYIENFFVEAGKKRCHIGTPTVMIHRSLFEQVGGFEPGRPHVEDLDMWLRIAHHYPKIGFLAEALAVVHLDVANVEFTKRRLESKKGKNERIIIARHLQLAEKLGTLSEFRPFAFIILRKTLLTLLYNGHKADTRETVTQFRDIFPWYWRLTTYVLTIFPGVTSAVARALVYLAYKLRFERQVTRRWMYSKS